MFKWIIEYWNPDYKEVECYSCAHGLWADAPINNVLYVYIQYELNNKVYTHVVSGYDFYFFNEKNNHFGGWNDYFDPDWGYGKEYKLKETGEKLIRKFKEKPSHINGRIVKLGVWIDPPWDELLGFVGSNRSIPNCKDILTNGD